MLDRDTQPGQERNGLGITAASLGRRRSGDLAIRGAKRAPRYRLFLTRAGLTPVYPGTAEVDETEMWPYTGRTTRESAMTSGPQRKRSARMEIRTTPEDRELIDRAVAASEMDLTQFVVSNLTVAAHRVLADRTEFSLNSESLRAWEKINRRPARDLAGLRELMQRPSPFVDE